MTRQCTIEGATEDVNVYSASFHAHLLGHEMYLDLWRDGERHRIRDEQLWHFDDQALETELKGVKGLVLKNGDILQSTCVYDSTGRSEATTFATGTSDEMCWASASRRGTRPDARRGPAQASATTPSIGERSSAKAHRGRTPWRPSTGAN